MQDATSAPASEPCRLIEEHFPGFAPAVVFDVGANVGRSATAFAAAFPEATIYAFEPVSSVYALLADNLAHEPRIRPFNAALGRSPGRAFATRRPTSVSNRIVDAPTMFERHRTESVAMTSGDAFSAEHGIERIGFLKIDAEGHDLEVLVGFQKMLVASRIDILEAEVGMNRENRRHVPFEAVKAYLEPLSYHLFHFHDLAMDTPHSGRAVLRRANAMFVSESFVEARRAAADKASA